VRHVSFLLDRTMDLFTRVVEPLFEARPARASSFRVRRSAHALVEISQASQSEGVHRIDCAAAS
jgi:hypothetical protein